MAHNKWSDVLDRAKRRPQAERHLEERAQKLLEKQQERVQKLIGQLDEKMQKLLEREGKQQETGTVERAPQEQQQEQAPARAEEATTAGEEEEDEEEAEGEEERETAPQALAGDGADEEESGAEAGRDWTEEDRSRGREALAEADEERADDEWQESAGAGEEHPSQWRPEMREAPRGAANGAAPDVLLEAPSVKVEEVAIKGERLQARVALHAALANFVRIDAGADIGLEQVDLHLKGVDAQAQLKVRLDEVAHVLDHALETIDRHPELLQGMLEPMRALGGALEAGAAPKEEKEAQGPAGGQLGDVTKTVQGTVQNAVAAGAPAAEKLTGMVSEATKTATDTMGGAAKTAGDVVGSAAAPVAETLSDTLGGLTKPPAPQPPPPKATRPPPQPPPPKATRPPPRPPPPRVPPRAPAARPPVPPGKHDPHAPG